MQPFIEAAQQMDEFIAIDGCPMVCARKVMENAGISAKYYLLTDMGLEKGKTTVTPELIEDICQRIKG
nr:putative zinc-binding protein [Sporomusa acidovorans]